MPTIAEACLRLGVTQKIFTKWLKRVNGFRVKEGKPPIELQQHPYDMRFHTITEDELAEIAEARAKMPKSPSKPPVAPLSALQRAPAPLPEFQPRPAPAKTRPIYAPTGLLPDDLDPVEWFLRRHGMRDSQMSTWRNARNDGNLQVIKHPGRGWQIKRNYFQYALDADGRRQAWELWHDTVWWKPCDDCLLDGHAVHHED